MAPSNLDPSKMLDLRSSGLESCFEGIVGYSWHDFASYLANGTYERYNQSQCIDLTYQIFPSTIRTMVVLTESLNSTEGGDLAIYQSNANFIPTNHLGQFGIEPDRLQGSMFSTRTWAFAVNDEVTFNATNYTITGCIESGLDYGTCIDAGDFSHWLSDFQPQSNKAVQNYIHANMRSAFTAHIETEKCINGHWDSENMTMGDCLVIPAEGKCQVLYNPPISIAIIVTATIKVAAMLLSAKLDRNRSVPLFTVGDAISSFLSRPDPTTTSACWLSKSDMSSQEWAKLGARIPGQAADPLKPRCLKRPRFWWQAVGATRWLVTLAL